MYMSEESKKQVKKAREQGLLIEMSDRCYSGAPPVYGEWTDPATGIVHQNVKLRKGVPYVRIA